MRKKLLFGVFLIIGITISVIIIQQKHQHSKQQFQHMQEDLILSYLEDGDIICRLGDRIWSTFFKELSPQDKRFSHLGIVRIRDDTVSVINAEGLAIQGKDYVNEVPLKDFLQNAQRVGIYRSKAIQGGKISDTALAYVGRPFDWQFDMDDDNKLYCSELLYVVLKKLDPSIELNKIWLKEMGKYIIPLDVVSQSEYFTEVGYWDRNTSQIHGKQYGDPGPISLPRQYL